MADTAAQIAERIEAIVAEYQAAADQTDRDPAERDYFQALATRNRRAAARRRAGYIPRTEGA